MAGILKAAGVAEDRVVIRHFDAEDVLVEERTIVFLRDPVDDRDQFRNGEAAALLVFFVVKSSEYIVE